MNLKNDPECCCRREVCTYDADTGCGSRRSFGDSWGRWVAPEMWKDCESCGGEGHTLHSRYGGNDPDVWSVRCEACSGSGGFVCEAEGVSRC